MKKQTNRSEANASVSLSLAAALNYNKRYGQVMHAKQLNLIKTSLSLSTSNIVLIKTMKKHFNNTINTVEGTKGKRKNMTSIN